MSVIDTDRWLLDSCSHPVKVCNNLVPYFNDTEPVEIYQYLSKFGMYLYQDHQDITLINNLMKKNAWEIIAKEEKRLKHLWDGPNIPIFIFPANVHNKRLINDFNGMAGLAFKDKLFLFLSEKNSVAEMRALFTHEYNHVCRLDKYYKNEIHYTLLDTIFLEGLAENAVRIELGSEYTAAWTKLYSIPQLEKVWTQHIIPNINSPIHTKNYQEILYGLGPYPNMSGYCVGYYLVKKYIQNQQQYKMKDLFYLPSNVIIEKSKSPK